MYRLILLLFAFLSLSLSDTSGQSLFPDRCIGKWEGTMYIYGKGQLRDSVMVKFTVAKLSEPDSWTWKKEYLSPTRPMTKDYIIQLIDQDAKVYATDEQNGIFLNEYLFDDKLYSVFETGGFLLTSSYELREDTLIFEVTSGRMAGTTGEDVQNYSVDNVQRVVFKKVSK